MATATRILTIRSGLQRLLALACCSLSWIPAAQAQDLNLPPSFGPIELVSGFEPDPAEYPLYAGGVIDLAETTDSSCLGFVGDAPDFRVTYSGNEFDYPLAFISESEVDTVMLINAPDGGWICNDDFSEELGFSAGIEFAMPEEGIYDIWVGVYESEAMYSPATLFITELGFDESEDVGSGTEGGTQVGNSLGSGTAFSVNDQGNLLTNYHVIEGCNRLTFQLPGQNPVEASVLGTDIDADLALLETNLLTLPAAFDLQNRPRLGDEIVVYGFPLLGDLSSQGNLTTGVVSALTGLGDDRNNFQISAQIQPGNSGGPVINRSGAIVGVVVSMADERYFSRQSGATPQNVNFAIAGTVIQSFLAAHGMGYSQSSNASRNLSVADIAERAQGFTGALICYQ